MPASTKTKAQQRADQIQAFQAEIKQLAEEQVLTLSAEQQCAVQAHHQTLLAQYARAYDIDKSQQEKQLSWGMRIASFLGAVALAASVFFMFYQFWGKLGTASQLVILLTAALASIVATIVIAGKEISGYFTKLMGLVAVACFVLNIIMLGQIFNITPSDKALIPWAAMALLLAYSLDIRLLLVAGILCIIAYVSARVGEWSGMYWIHFGERPENFIAVGVLLFFLPQFIDHSRYAGFAATYRVFGLITLLLAVLILAFWGESSYFYYNPEIIEGCYQVAGFILSGVAIWLGVRKHWGDVIHTGTTFFFIFLYTKIFDWWWDIMPKYLFFLVLGLIAILFISVLKRMRRLGRGAAQEVVS